MKEKKEKSGMNEKKSLAGMGEKVRQNSGRTVRKNF